MIVEGDFFEPERDEYLSAITTDTEPRFVTLAVSYEEALRRAEADPTRGPSRDPVFLRQHFDTLAIKASVSSSDLLIDTGRVRADEAVTQVLSFMAAVHRVDTKPSSATRRGVWAICEALGRLLSPRPRCPASAVLARVRSLGWRKAQDVPRRLPCTLGAMVALGKR